MKASAGTTEPAISAASPVNKSIAPSLKAINQSVFCFLPATAFIRAAQLVQSPKRPEVPAPLPFSSQTLWRKVKDGTFPAPVKLSKRVTAWRVQQVREWILAQAEA